MGQIPDAKPFEVSFWFYDSMRRSCGFPKTIEYGMFYVGYLIYFSLNPLPRSSRRSRKFFLFFTFLLAAVTHREIRAHAVLK
jgi:hypothetical protein